MLVPTHQYFSHPRNNPGGVPQGFFCPINILVKPFFKRRSYSTTYKLIENYAGVEF